MYTTVSLHTPAMRFEIDPSVDESELNRRESCERMLLRAPACLLNIAAIDTVMQSRKFFCIWTHLDATTEYAVDGSADETAIYFQRDWGKTGLLHTPYHMLIATPGGRESYYRVRSVAQLGRILTRRGYDKK
jgi:hypothetical protein